MNFKEFVNDSISEHQHVTRPVCDLIEKEISYHQVVAGHSKIYLAGCYYAFEIYLLNKYGFDGNRIDIVFSESSMPPSLSFSYNSFSYQDKIVFQHAFRLMAEFINLNDPSLSHA